jgi:uncharacterized protein (DUF362 family)
VGQYETFLNIFVSQAHADGGWGYAPGQPAQLEPTCLGLLALALASEGRSEGQSEGLTGESTVAPPSPSCSPFPPPISREIDMARSFLARAACADGSYRPRVGRGEAVWPTSLVLFTRAVLGDPAEELRRTAGFLLGLRGQVPDNPEAGELHDIDLMLTGWPWGERNFSWVEPTTWACLALRRLGHGGHPRAQEGERLLLDRAMDDGGINYGNRRVLGKLTEPIPGPTALMLIALQGQDHPRIVPAVHYLVDQLRTADLEHLCWGKLALDLYRHVPGVAEALSPLDEAILAGAHQRADTPWLRPNCLRQALVILALGTGKRNLFRLPTDQARPAEVLPIEQSRRGSLTARVGSWVRGVAVRAFGQLRAMPAQSAVHIARAGDYGDDLAGILQGQYQHFRETVPLAGKRVVLKPNLVEYHRDKVINTDPLVVAAVIELCKREGAADVVVAEGPGHWRNVEYLVSESGLGDVLSRHGVPFVDLNHDEPVKTPNLGRLTGLDYLYLSKTIATADVVISLPKLKTHHWAGATLSLKNLFGTLPGICYGWPKNELHWRGIDNSIVDIALTRTPELAIVDAIIGMEGDGPLNGTARHVGALVMGHDLVAVDATCCRLMHLDADRIGYLILGNRWKLGRLRAEEIPQLDESIDALAQPFETVPHLQALRLRRSA